MTHPDDNLDFLQQIEEEQKDVKYPYWYVESLLTLIEDEQKEANKAKLFALSLIEKYGSQEDDLKRYKEVFKIYN